MCIRDSERGAGEGRLRRRLWKERTGADEMSLYAIGDLHLAFSVDKPMDLFDRVWKNHEKKIEKFWNRRIRPEDTVVLTGDHCLVYTSRSGLPGFEENSWHGSALRDNFKMRHV